MFRTGLRLSETNWGIREEFVASPADRGFVKLPVVPKALLLDLWLRPRLRKLCATHDALAIARYKKRSDGRLQMCRKPIRWSFDRCCLQSGKHCLIRLRQPSFPHLWSHELYLLQADICLYMSISC